MRIGHFSPGLFHPGGIASYLHRLVEAQQARGHTLILFDRQELMKEAPGSSSTEIVTLATDAELFAQVRDRQLDVLHVHRAVETPLDGVRHPASRCAWVRTMHGNEAYCSSGTQYLAWPHGRPCPRVHHLLGCTWGRFGNHCGSVRPGKILQEFNRIRWELKNSKHFFTVANSEFVRDQMVRAGHDTARIRVLPCPALSPVASEISLRVTSGGPLRLLFLGRLVPTKGAEWLLRATARVNVPFHLDFAGMGPQEPDLRSLASRLKLSERISWLGWADQTQVRAYLARSHVVVMPSIWQEPAGLVTLDAAAAGRALIASRVGGIPEYVEKLGHGLLVPPGDVDALAAAITRLANDPELVATLGHTGWQRLTEGVLGLNEHLARLEEIYSMSSSRAESTASRL